GDLQHLQVLHRADLLVRHPAVRVLDHLVGVQADGGGAEHALRHGEEDRLAAVAVLELAGAEGDEVDVVAPLLQHVGVLEHLGQTPLLARARQPVSRLALLALELLLLALEELDRLARVALGGDAEVAVERQRLADLSLGEGAVPLLEVGDAEEQVGVDQVVRRGELAGRVEQAAQDRDDLGVLAGAEQALGLVELLLGRLRGGGPGAERGHQGGGDEESDQNRHSTTFLVPASTSTVWVSSRSVAGSKKVTTTLLRLVTSSFLNGSERGLPSGPRTLSIWTITSGLSQRGSTDAGRKAREKDS